MRYNPHDYQRYVTDAIIQKKRLAVFLDMGLGKTSCTLSAISQLIYDYLEVSKVLIISPLKVARLTWEEEIQKWDDFRHLRISKAVGTRERRIRALNADADIYIINRENTEWLLNYYKAGHRWPFQMMVIDESSSFKDRSSHRWKAAKVLSQAVDRLVELTGTPAPNGLMDLWAQIYLIDGGRRLHPTLTAYREAFFMPDKRNANVVFSYKLRPGMDREIEKRISDIAISMRASDHLKLPDRVDNVISIDMPPSVRKKYDEMERDYLVTINEEEVAAASAGAVAGKLFQMANGAVYFREENLVRDPSSPTGYRKAVREGYVELHDLKIRALREIMEANEGKPVMVFYQYRHDLERLKKAFADLNPRELKTDQDKKDWDSHQIQMLLAHPASMGHGLNLQAGGSVIVWFGLTYNLEQYQQANARLYRQGQTDTVIIHHLVVLNTMDEEALAALSRKAKTQDELVNAVKAKIRKAKEAKP